ncbi:hypothetical protein PAPYR_512 [Paratrimastix pyriformis]|uniref:Uncharacterized protein n=1 Tax=Paratrimastix pyriformis TaxID=342808 RepID=A0ABQ8V0E3_9EUKA|nr:hypothetical protein PAPYR_512 [Paratrimastix pyriformis]
MPREKNKRRKSACHAEQVDSTSRDPDQSSASTMMDASAEISSFFALLPPDLLPCMVEASDHALLTYVKLLSLSHGIRLAVRGTPRELSFDDNLRYREIPFPTADAVAALVGPCKGLVKLSFRSSVTASVYGCGHTDAACAGWVDEAFGGHDRLAVLDDLPTFNETVNARILLRLPGLLELHLGIRTKISAHLLAVIAASCPHLRVLQSNQQHTTQPSMDLTGLVPLAGSLQEFGMTCLCPSPNLDAFVGSLSALGTLNITHCSSAALRPLDQPQCGSGLAKILAAHPATLQRLALVLVSPNAGGMAALMSTLDALPRLTQLYIKTGRALPPGIDITALPASLLGLLEELCLQLDNDPEDDEAVRLTALRPLSFTSGRLKCLDLKGLGRVSGLTVDCPALVELRLPEVPTGGPLSLKCPRLRVAQNLPAWFPGFSGPMPDLETVFFVESKGRDPACLPDLLAGGSPLRDLFGVVLHRPDLLSRLCACDTLVDLSLVLDQARQLPNPLVLQFPSRLQSLCLSIGRQPPESESEEWTPSLDLRVEAPGLRSFEVSHSDLALRIRLNCPALITLSLKLWDQAESIELFDARTQPQTLLFCGDCQSASLLAVTINKAPATLSLSCPQLRMLELMSVEERRVEGRRVELTCPLLESLHGLQDPSSQLVLMAPAPNLPPLDTLDDDKIEEEHEEEEQEEEEEEAEAEEEEEEEDGGDGDGHDAQGDDV